MDEIDQRKLKKLIRLLNEAGDLLRETDLRLLALSGSVAIYHKDRSLQDIGEDAIIAYVDNMETLVDGGDA